MESAASLETFMDNSIMPRHLMVRRFHDSVQGYSQAQEDMERTPLIQYGDNADMKGNTTVKLDTSTNYQRNYFPQNSILATEMSWESLKLVEFDTDNDDGDQCSDEALRTIADKSTKHDLSRDGYGRMIVPSSDLDGKVSDTVNSCKDKLILAFQKIDSLTMTSTFREHKPVKNTNISPRKRNNENVSEYGVLGVKKNFLRRSESSGYSRLHKMSPNKTCPKNSSLGPLTLNTNMPKSCKQHSRKYSPSKNVSFSKHIVIRSRAMRLSEQAASLQADDLSSVLEHCQLPHNGAEIDTCSIITPFDLRSASTTCHTSSNNIDTLISGFKYSRNNREVTTRATIETDRAPSPVPQPVSQHSKVLKERTLQRQLSDPSQNIIDLSLPRKHTVSSFREDNKENSPLVVAFKKAQSPKCNKQTEKNYTHISVANTDYASQISSNDLHILGNNYHIPQHDLRLPGNNCHISERDLHIPQHDLDISHHDLHIPEDEADNSKCADISSLQQELTDDHGDDDDDDDDDDGDDTDDDATDEDACSSNADSGTSDTMQNNIELGVPPAPSPWHDSQHLASTPQEATNVCFATPEKQEIASSSDLSPILDVDGDTPIKVTRAARDSGVYVDMSSNAGRSMSKDDLSGAADAAGQDSSAHRSSLLRLSVSPVVPQPANQFTSNRHHPMHSSTLNRALGDSAVFVDVSSNAGRSMSKHDLSGPADTAGQDSSACGSSLTRLSISPVDPPAANQLVTQGRHHPTSMHTSTPVATIVQPWLQPQPVVHAVPAFQQSMYPFMPIFAPQPQYQVLPPASAFQHYAQGTLPHPLPHPAFSPFVFASHPHALPPGSLRTAISDQYASRHINPSLFLDQPLNLTNRRPFQAPVADPKVPHNSVYAARSSPPGVPAASPPVHLFHLAGASAGIYPIASSSTNLFPGDPRASQNVPRFSGAQNLPGASFVLPALPNPKECPLNLSSAVKHPKRKPTQCENIEGQSESKRGKAAKKSRKVKSLALPNDAVTNNNAEAPAESTGKSQALLRISPNQFIRGISFALPPPNWRPISRLMKAKDNFEDDDRKTSRTLKSKENITDGDNETAKQRNKPELFGDKEITELRIAFYDCSERQRFCDGSFKFQVPKIPDGIEGQAELREALLRLFGNSNLPPVPSALKHSVHALSQYPFMQHIFNMHAQGVNLDNLKFGAYGLAFENIHLVEMGEQNFNDILDRMSYLGEDDLLHCLVKSEKTGAVCGHVAREIGKIRRHSKNHYPDKKWVCVFCRVQMCDMTDLERHTATHTELKPFECPQCSKKFCQKVTLTQHMHKTHGQELAKWDAKSSYICRQDGCSYSQGDEMACVRHLKQHHGQSDYIKRKNQNKWPFNVLSADAVNSIDVEA